MVKWSIIWSPLEQPNFNSGTVYYDQLIQSYRMLILLSKSLKCFHTFSNFHITISPTCHVPSMTLFLASVSLSSPAMFWIVVSKQWSCHHMNDLSIFSTSPHCTFISSLCNSSLVFTRYDGIHLHYSAEMKWL